MEYFRYGKKEMDYLSERDDKLAAVIKQYGKLNRKVNPSIFEALVSSIIAQQISNKAAGTVNARLKELLGEVTPATIGACDHQSIQQCGMTGKKANYIKTSADAILLGKINLDNLPSLTDKAIIGQLTSLPGVGLWTAEMLLLHALQRPDIFSHNDLVINRNLMALHHLDKMDKTTFKVYKKLYSPYGSVAMIYLWHQNT